MVSDLAMLLAQQGRGGDARVGHLTQNELVVPPRVLQANPQLSMELARGFAGAGLPIGRYLVGGPDDSINPATGLREFFDDRGDRGLGNDTGTAGGMGGNPDDADRGLDPTSGVFGGHGFGGGTAGGPAGRDAAGEGTVGVGRPSSGVSSGRSLGAIGMGDLGPEFGADADVSEAEETQTIGVGMQQRAPISPLARIGLNVLDFMLGPVNFSIPETVKYGRPANVGVSLSVPGLLGTALGLGVGAPALGALGSVLGRAVGVPEASISEIGFDNPVSVENTNPVGQPATFSGVDPTTPPGVGRALATELASNRRQNANRGIFGGPVGGAMLIP